MMSSQHCYVHCLCATVIVSMIVVQQTSGGFSEFGLTVEPADTVVLSDRPLTLDCVARFTDDTGTHTASIQWLKDSQPFALSPPDKQVLSNGSLYVESQLAEEGAYQCRASVSNVGVLLSRLAYVRISYMERTFEVEPENVTAYMGDVVMFACKIGGILRPSITWLKDDHEISVASTNFVVHEENGILEIRSVQFTDFGRYRCKAVSGDRSKLSRTAMLVQNSDPSTYRGVSPQFIVRPVDEVAVDGATVVLFCAANGRDHEGGKPNIVWLKDGAALDLVGQHGRFSVVGESNLRIDSVMEADSALYTCRASNQQDFADAHALLKVHVGPKLRQRPRNVIADVKSDHEFVCDVYANPSPTVYWLKNGMNVTRSDYVQVVNSRMLRILGLLPSDAGMYQCMADAGALGSLQTAAQLIVQAPVDPAGSGGGPSEPVGLTAPIVSLDFLTLSWTQPENPGLSDISGYTIQWNEAGSIRQRELNVTVLEANLQNLKSSTRYVIRVVAFNSYGCSETPARLTVQTQTEAAVPDAPRNLQVFARSPLSMFVSWDSPAPGDAAVLGYTVHYYDVSSSETLEMELNVTSNVCMLVGLKKYHQYGVRVVAFNAVGFGASTQEVYCRTLSDEPAAAPQNVSAEAVSAASIIVSWDPLPEESTNGIVTGYRIRYRQNKDRRQSIVAVDGTQAQCTLSSLTSATEYSARVQAMTVNGTGPSSPWKSATTFAHDLDESRVPGEPTSLHVRPMIDSIVVSWTPPSTAEHNVMIRGYILGYGIGVPDVYRQILDPDVRLHTIRGLESSSEYVISLKAFNNAGHGKPIYETTITREERVPEPPTPLLPPVGVRAPVLSATTIVVMWTDTSLGRRQRVTGNSIYTVRYQLTSGSGSSSAGRRQKMINTTKLNIHVNDLRPDTEYEFSVKIIRGRRQSAWSLSVFNKTFEMAPTSSVRDLTPVSIENWPTAISLNWQPPRQTNGQITGYQVSYTTDATYRDRDWVRHDVPGDRLSTTVRELSPQTTYYFKIQARNNAGYGPMSPTVIFRTPRLDGTGGGSIDMPDDYGSRQQSGGILGPRYGSSTPLPVTGVSSITLWIVISVIGGITLVAVGLVIAVLCYRKCTKKQQPSRQNVSYMPANKGKPSSIQLDAPDLWASATHRTLDRSDEVDEGTAMMSQCSHDSFDGHKAGDMDCVDRYRHLHSSKPVMIPVDRPIIPREGSDHVIYPHSPVAGLPSSHLYSGVPRVNAGELLSSQYPRPASSDAGSTSGSSKVRRDVQRPNVASIQTVDVVPDVAHRPAVTSDQSRPANSPQVEKPVLPMSTNLSASSTVGYSTEELSAEMANLEGLMKDLSAITQQQQEFDC